MALRYEAWSTPWDPGGFKRKVAILPVIEGTGRGSVEFMSVGRDASADISLANFNRLDDLVSDTKSSLVAVYDCDHLGNNVLIDEWVLDRVPQRFTEDRHVSLAGPNLLREAFDKALVYAFDYPKSPSVTRDWIWGKNQDDDSTGLIRNGTFEDVPMPNGGFEDGNAGHWQGTESDDNLIANGAISAVSSATDARTGSWYGLVNPAAQGGGARRSIAGLVPGENYTITGWINESSASGDRLRAGVIGASTATHTNAYEEPTDPDIPGIWWAEIGNATQGNGASDGTWQSVTLTFKPESDSVELVIIYDDVNDRSFRIDDWAISGDNVGLDPWIPFSNSGAQGGEMTLARYSTSRVHSGAGSCEFQGIDGPFYDGFGRIGYGTLGITQNIRMVPGRLYTFTAWVQHAGNGANGATERIRLVLARNTPKGEISKTLTGDFIPGPGSYYMAHKDELVPQNTWTKIQLTVYADVSDISAQIRYAGTNQRNTDLGTFTSPNIWVDDVSIHEGLPATSIGDIWQTLLDDCTTNHANDTRGTVLEWIDYSSFDATNDSNGTPWNEDIPFLARWGSTMGHVLDDTFDRGYEIELVRKTTPSGGKTHDLHLYNSGGRDDNPSTAIHSAQPITGGESLRRNPAYTSVMVASPQGAYTEDSDATALTNFGRSETFQMDSEASGPVSRQLLADNLLNYEQSNRNAVRFDVIEATGVPRPFHDYRPGDTIPMTMAPGLMKEDRRVQRVDYVNTQPARYSVVGSRIIEGEAAAFDLVARLWRRMQRPGKFEDPDLGVGGGADAGFFAIDVAAADAPSWEKAVARYQCDGVDDHVEIQQALDDTFLAGLSPFFSSRVQLSSGGFNVSMASIFVNHHRHLRGMGKFATRIQNQDVGVGSDNPQFSDADYLIEVEDEGEVSEIGFRTTNDFIGTCIVAGYGIVHDIHHEQGNARHFVYFDGTLYPSYNLSSWGNYDKAMIYYGETWIEHHGIFHQGRGTTLWFDVQVWANGTVSNVHIDSDDAHAIVFEEIGTVNLANLTIAAGPSPFTETDWAAFHLLGSPGHVNISNVVVESAGYLLYAPISDGSLGAGLTVNNVIAQNIWRSVVYVPNGMFGSGFALRNIHVDYCGDSDAIRLGIGNDTVFDLSNFRFIEVGGKGIHLTPSFTATSRNTRVRINNGAIGNGSGSEGAVEDGIVIEGLPADIRDVGVTAGLGAANTYDAVRLSGLIEHPRVDGVHIKNPDDLRYGINISEASVEQAIVVGNSDEGGSYGTDALNDQGTGTQLFYPSDATYGDNFFLGSLGGIDQIEPVTALTLFNERERETVPFNAVVPVTSNTITVTEATETESSQTITPT